MQDDHRLGGHSDFDRETYLKILITIARADKENGPPTYFYIRKQAIEMGVDYEKILRDTTDQFTIRPHKVSRLTALRVLRDAIIIASMGNSFTLSEKQNIYTYAEQLDIPRSDVNELEIIVREMKTLEKRWDQLVAGHPNE